VNALAWRHSSMLGALLMQSASFMAGLKFGLLLAAAIVFSTALISLRLQVTGTSD